MQIVFDFDRRDVDIWLLQIGQEFLHLSQQALVIFCSSFLLFLEFILFILNDLGLAFLLGHHVERQQILGRPEQDP